MTSPDASDALPAPLPVVALLVAPDAERGDPLPLAVRRSPLWRWATPVLSVAILLAVFWQLRTLDFARVRELIPTSPSFWLVFVAFYISPIAFDFVIFRRLWQVPAEAFVALARKLVSNELLFDYIGEVYFYGWARKKLRMATSPFGAVKDVAILSALTGNAVTLVMLIIAWPLLDLLRLSVAVETLLLSVGILIGVSMLFIIFGKRVFSLTKGELWFVAGVQLARIVVGTALSALLWSLALPKVPLDWWLLLATVRLLLSRLPLLTNKDVLFAGVAVFIIGHDSDIQALMALMATLILGAHVIVGLGLALGDLVTLRIARKKG